jgi:two-component system, OmpR family, response regulator VicR
MGQARVLVVDDQRDTVALIELLLRHEGFEVITARSGEEALQQFETGKPDAVVLDLNLPNMPGWEVYRILKEQRDIPIVVVTERDAYFIKPFDITILPPKLRELLGGKKKK